MVRQGQFFLHFPFFEVFCDYRPAMAARLIFSAQPLFFPISLNIKNKNIQCLGSGSVHLRAKPVLAEILSKFSAVREEEWLCPDNRFIPVCRSQIPVVLDKQPAWITAPVLSIKHILCAQMAHPCTVFRLDVCSTGKRFPGEQRRLHGSLKRDERDSSPWTLQRVYLRLIEYDMDCHDQIVRLLLTSRISGVPLHLSQSYIFLLSRDLQQTGLVP